MHRDGGPRVKNSHGGVFREIFQTTDVDLLVFAEAVVLLRRRVRNSVRQHYDVERREHQILALDQSRNALEERVEIRQSIARRVFLSEIRRNLGHTHILEGMNGLNRFGLSSFFPPTRPDEDRRGLLESAQSMNVGVEIVGGEIDGALVPGFTTERAADIDRDDE